MIRYRPQALRPGETSHWYCTVCGADCTTQPGITTEYCGDSVVNGPEECDDGNTTTEPCEYGDASCTDCGADCTAQPGTRAEYCGDGVVNGPED